MTISKKLKIFSIQILLSVIPLSLLFSTDLSAELVIKVTKGNDKPTEIAIDFCPLLHVDATVDVARHRCKNASTKSSRDFD